MVSEKINVIVVSGLREKLQMASMVASIAAVSGNVVQIFISMNALQFFVMDNQINVPFEGQIGQLMEQKNVPSFKMLFQQAIELGDAKMYPCSMAMDVLGVKQEDIEPYLEEATGLTKFLDDARGGQIWTF